MNHRKFQWVLFNEVHEIQKQIEAIVRETNKKVKQTARELLKIQLWGKKERVNSSWTGCFQERVFEIALQESALYCLT